MNDLTPERKRNALSGEIAWGIVYSIAAAGIAIAWTLSARTERHADGCSNIVRMFEGTALRPFVFRRLTVDSAALLARIVPQSTWHRVSTAIDANPKIHRLVREKSGWTRQWDALLASATLIVAISALGFMLSFLWLVRRLYHVQSLRAHLLALVFGVGLLGGRGVWPGMYLWDQYIYDIPQAFLFLLGVCTIVAGTLWFPPVFLLAAYNKETSILLLPALVLLWPKSIRIRWGLATVLFIAFVGIQVGIRLKYHNTTGPGFWLLHVNLAQIFIFGIWRLPVWGLAILAVWRHWHDVPRPLRKLIYVPFVLMLAALFKGLIFELRGYMEAYPLVGIVFIQTLAQELGMGGMLQPRILFEPNHRERYDPVSV
jgi:hypothetical protein